MEFDIPVTLNGVRMGEKKDKSKYYTADLYAEGIGAFNKNISPDEYVQLASLRGQTLSLRTRVVIKDRAIPVSGGRSFNVQEPGLNLGDITIPEAAASTRRAS